MHPKCLKGTSSVNSVRQRRCRQLNHRSGLTIERAAEKSVDRVFFKAPASIFLELYRNPPANICLNIN